MGFSLFGIINIVLFNSVCLLAAYSHFQGKIKKYASILIILAMTTDPGAVPRDARPLDDDQQERDHEAKLAEEGAGLERYKKFCKRCKTFKPSRAHHCSMCGRCIIKMDHHCP